MKIPFIPSKDKNWTLFLDRDGVINVRPVNDYVKKVQDFHFIEGVLESFKILNGFFHRIIVVTNQQGVGLGRMSATDLNVVHDFMLETITKAGGKIDRIYACTDLHLKPLNCRKPGTQMAYQAKDDFPETDFETAVMVGDTETDIQFGRACGMYCVLVGNEKVETKPDLHFVSLAAFVHYLSTIQQTD